MPADWRPNWRAFCALALLRDDAAFVRFLDFDRRAPAVLDGNLAALGAAPRRRIDRVSRPAVGSAAGRHRAGGAGWIAPGAVAVVEHPAGREVAPPTGFRTVPRRRHGRAALLFPRRDSLPSVPPTPC